MVGLTESGDSSTGLATGETGLHDHERGDATAQRLPVCVIIPAYNRAELLPRCIKSVWSQRPALPAEVIVVDDGSRDGTALVAEQLGARVIRHLENRGAAAARNTAAHATSCEWLALLDTDDEWLPDHLQHLWKLRSDHVLVGASSLRCRGDGIVDGFNGPPARRPLILRSPDRLLSTCNMFTASASMVRRDVAVEMGGFTGHFGVAEDLGLWVRVLEHHSAICSPRVTVRYYIHSDNKSANLEREWQAHREIAEEHRMRSGRSRGHLERFEGVVAWDGMRAALAAGDRRQALRKGADATRNAQRVLGVIRLLASRCVLRRNASRVGRDGSSSVAVLLADGRDRGEVIERLHGRKVHDLSHVSTPRALVELAGSPTGLAVVDSRRQGALLRMVGVPAVRANEFLESFDRSKGRSGVV